MPKHGKKYNASAKKVAKRLHTVPEAVATMRSAVFVKFDETVELAMHLGVDPKHADQMVRGTVVLPHGGGKTKKVAVIAAGEKLKEATAAGADIVGGADLVKQIKGASAHLATHQFTHGQSFKWQGGYGAFSVSPRHIGEVRDYSLGQMKHHASGALIADWELTDTSHTNDTAGA